MIYKALSLIFSLISTIKNSNIKNICSKHYTADEMAPISQQLTFGHNTVFHFGKYCPKVNQDFEMTFFNVIRIL
ncbi:MAG: hypothetical protein ACI8P3_003489 [Saprospiraceae bacterium]|jgi:hypothetical protein